MRPLVDRLIRLIAKTAIFGWFRSLEVEGMERFPRTGPVVIVAPHFNGVIDPALLAATLPRMPRFLAMSTLWKVPGLRPILAFVGAVPVYRASEGSTARNEGMFDACHRVLGEGGAIAIFPEGKVNARYRLLPLKTGAARIALGARADGVRGVRIVPVGTIFEDRNAIRSRAVVRVGEPIDLDGDAASFVAPSAPEGETNHQAVDRLTAGIQLRLQAVTVDFGDAAEAMVFDLAARAAIRDPQASPRIEIPMADAWALAARLEHAPPAERAAVLATTERYRAHLDLLGLDDRDVVPGNTERRFLRRYRHRAARFAAAAPFAAVGAVVNAAPALAVHEVGKRVRTTMGQATPKLLASIVLFPVTWVALAVSLRASGSRHPWLSALVAGPGCGWATLYAFERWERNRRDVDAWGRLGRSRDALDELRAQRSDVVNAVSAVLAVPAATT